MIYHNVINWSFFLKLPLLVPLIYCVQTFYHKFCNYGFSPSSPSIDSLYFSSLDILRANILTQIFVIMVFHLRLIDSFVFQFPWYITCKHFITNFRNYGFSPSSLSIHSFYFSSLDILRANILTQIFVIMVFHLRLQLTLLYFSSLDILRASILSQIFVIMVFHLLRFQYTLFILVPLIYYVQIFYHKFL